MVENQTDRKLKSLRSDNGGEYKCDEFVQFCRERSIRREFMAPHSPQQNGVAERMNRTIQERIVYAAPFRTFGWLLGQGTTHGRAHYQHVAE
jgi:transposase InsO family protein